MRVLVIGGTGFVGTSVVSQLRSAGHEVVVFHRGETLVPPGVAAVVGDRHNLDASRQQLRAAHPDIVIDLIACSGRQAAALMRVFRGVANRVVVASSMDVYRAAAVLHRIESGEIEPTPLTERSRLRTSEHVYPPKQLERLMTVFPWIDEAYDKISVERVVANDPELPSTVLRLPMMYGPGDRLHRLRPYVIRMDDRREAIPLPESLAQWRAPRGYVENIAAAIVLAATRSQAAGRTYNVAEAQALTELQWAARIADAADWHGDLVVVPDADCPEHLRVNANMAQHWNADSSLIRRELAYVEPVSQAEAIRRTVACERRTPLLPQDFDACDYEAEDRALACTRTVLRLT